MKTFVLANASGFSAEKLAKHNLFTTPRFFLDVYNLQPGQSQRPHSHDASDKVYVVLEGTCRFEIGDEVADHGPGVAVLAPAGVSHGVTNASAANARLLVFMAPLP